MKAIGIGVLALLAWIFFIPILIVGGVALVAHAVMVEAKEERKRK